MENASDFAERLITKAIIVGEKSFQFLVDTLLE
jgi:hypothetical protein